MMQPDASSAKTVVEDGGVIARLQTELKLRKSQGELQTLSGLLPICSHCKKIRDDQGYWKQLEAYIQTHSDALFSHGICPECFETYYGKKLVLPDKTDF